eukprot:scaffold131139_cov39-Prasinocladus_malaysianus.AAC.1
MRLKRQNKCVVLKFEQLCCLTGLAANPPRRNLDVLEAQQIYFHLLKCFCLYRLRGVGSEVIAVHSCGLHSCGSSFGQQAVCRPVGMATDQRMKTEKRVWILRH